MPLRLNESVKYCSNMISLLVAYFLVQFFESIKEGAVDKIELSNVT